jgi:hypothetical protein
MPITPSPIERQLMKKEEVRVGLPWRLLTIAVLTFGTSIAIYLGMSFGLKPFLSSQVKNLDNQLEQLANSISADEAQGFLTFYSQLTNMDSVLKNRKSPSAFFDFLEKNTFKNIYFTSMSINYTNNMMRLEGRAPDFETLAEQMEVFKNAPEILRVIVNNSNLSEDKSGGIRFSMQINFK